LNYKKAYFIALRQSKCFADSKYLNLALANTNDFAETFQCETRTPMNPEEKCFVEV